MRGIRRTQGWVHTSQSDVEEDDWVGLGRLGHGCAGSNAMPCCGRLSGGGRERGTRRKGVLYTAVSRVEKYCSDRYANCVQSDSNKLGLQASRGVNFGARENRAEAGEVRLAASGGLGRGCGYARRLVSAGEGGPTWFGFWVLVVAGGLRPWMASRVSSWIAWTRQAN